jgi:uncharacterized protein DUF6519
MKGDFTRMAFRRTRSYSGLLKQQGRVQLDSDWVLNELLARFPVDSADWTDFNASDPGVTLIDLFTFLGEVLLWQIDEQERRRRRRHRLALLVVGTVGVGLALWTWGRAEPT